MTPALPRNRFVRFALLLGGLACLDLAVCALVQAVFPYYQSTACFTFHLPKKPDLATSLPTIDQAVKMLQTNLADNGVRHWSLVKTSYREYDEDSMWRLWRAKSMLEKLAARLRKSFNRYRIPLHDDGFLLTVRDPEPGKAADLAQAALASVGEPLNKMALDEMNLAMQKYLDDQAVRQESATLPTAGMTSTSSTSYRYPVCEIWDSSSETKPRLIFSRPLPHILAIALAATILYTATRRRRREPEPILSGATL